MGVELQGVTRTPPVLQESEDDDEEEEEEEDDDEDEDDDDDNGDSSEEGGDSSESSSEEESEDGDEVRPWHTGRAPGGAPLTLLRAGGHPDRSKEPPGHRGTRGGGGGGEQDPPGVGAVGHSQEQPPGTYRGVWEGCAEPPQAEQRKKISCLFPGGDTESGLGSVCASANAE